MGSQIGLRLLVAHPDRVRRAVAGGIGMNVTTPWKAGEAIARRLRGDETEQSPAAAMFYNFAMAVPGNDLEALACCITARSAPLTEEQLAAIQTPVLVAVGGADPIVSDPRRLAELLPHGDYFEVPGISDRRRLDSIADEDVCQLHAILPVECEKKIPSNFAQIALKFSAKIFHF